MSVAGRPKLILHIGAGKAGSSAIQAFLGQHSTELAHNGYVVPGDDLSITPGSGQQTAYFQKRTPFGAAEVAQVQSRLAALRQHAVRVGASTVIVSAENLLNAGDNVDGFIRLFEGIADLFDVTVVTYIRRQDQYLTASWAQWYFKVTPDFRTWFEKIKGELADWSDALGPWERDSSNYPIVVRIFDRSRLVGGDVVTDFLDVIGTDPADYGYEPGQIINPTLNEIATRIAHRNRDLSIGLHDHRFMNFLKTLGGTPALEPVETGLYLSADERRDLLAMYAASNELIRERYLPSLPPNELFPPVSEGVPPIGGDRQLQMELDLLWHVTYETYRRIPRGSVTRGLIDELSAKARRVARRGK